MMSNPQGAADREDPSGTASGIGRTFGLAVLGAAIMLAPFLGTIMATSRAAIRDPERGHREKRDVMSTDQLQPAAKT